MSTVYDNTVGVWFWKGTSVLDETVEETVRTIKQWAPAINAIYVKTSDGGAFQGQFDTDQDFAINGPSDIDKWTRVLIPNGIAFHAWAVVKGQNIAAEAKRIVDICRYPGVTSMVLDVEPFSGFWTAGPEPIRPLMELIRAGAPEGFPIAMAVDPRPQHKPHIYPDRWKPYINAVHLQLYWETFDRPVEDVLDEGFQAWGDFGRPVYPILQASAGREDMERARRLVVETYGTRGLSWWRLGAFGPYQYAPINRAVNEKARRMGFDPPVGTPEERASDTLWPGGWFDATGFARRYKLGTSAEAYHTGADLNLNTPVWDADKGAPCYAIGDGEVTFAGAIGSWGNVIVIRHDPLSDGQIVYSRYAHGDNLRVRKSDRVARGQHIFDISSGGGRFANHLHFDISHTDILERDPGHWPGLSYQGVVDNYLDPLEFIRNHRPGGY